VYLKTQGIDPSQHPVKKEIQRIQSYMQKLREKQSNATQNKTDIDEDDSKEDTRTMKLDKEAAQRFLTNTLNKPEAKNSSEDPSPKKRKRKDSEKGNQKKMKTNK
jgi:exosome complex protein LRP1